MRKWSKLGLVAGGGDLPLRLAAAAAKTGGVHVVRLEGLAAPALRAFPGEDCGLAEAGRIIRSLKDAACDAVALAGVVRRPDFKNLKPDWRGAALLPRLIAAAAKGDGALLGVLVDTFEAEGFLVVGAEEVMANLAAPAGPFGRLRPDEEAWRDIRKGAALVAALGPFDVGQAAVVSRGFVVAIEAAEGTDAMLERSARLRAAQGRAGVLLKRPKPGQELRVDLPVVGAETIRRAAAAGLAGVAVEAGAALVIDLEATAAAADEHGLFAYGFSPAELAGP
jgi:hypothetical protein